MLISICIPCYKSETFLADTVGEIKAEFALHPEHDYQLVLVNDGSPDGTFRTITRLCEEDDKIIGIDLSKNHGQATAKLVAVRYATGDAAVFMDDDGQHPASGIFKLIDKLNEGYDVVYARFSNRQHSGFKRITSRMKKRLAEFNGTKIKGIDTSPFMAWSKVPMEAIKSYNSPFPSTGSFLRCVTDRFANVDIEHRPRREGKSGYTLSKMFKLWLDGMVNFTMTPLRVASYTGIVLAFLGFIATIAIIIRKIVHPTMVMGYASTMSVMVFIGGCIMLMLGIIGEYVGRIYMIISDKPQFTVSRVINSPEKDD